jgi:curli biogenesis system outer membrane secretion channel CsgG
MRSSSPLAVALCGAPILLAAACGTVAVRVPVMRPAEINMAPYSSVAVGEMRGRGDPRALSDGLEEALVTSGKFQVVDRQHLAETMRELQLSSTDLADPTKVAKLGQLVPAGALIYGDIDERYNERTDETPYKTKEGKQHVVRTLTGEAGVRATFKVVDVSSGRLLIARTYEDKRQETSRIEDARPAPIDREELTQRARRTVLERFLKAIVPYREYVFARFEKDSDIPQLEGGIGWAEQGNWDKAKEAFNNALADAGKNPKVGAKQLGKAYWDLGLAHEYSGDYDNAAKMVQKAYDVGQDKDYLRELEGIDRLRSEAKRLAEQSRQPEAAGAR